MAFRVVDEPQRSEAWFAARLGCLTGSVAGDMLAKRASGGEAAGRRNLRLRLVLERLTNRPQESGYVSPAMQAGIDREDDARRAYQVLTGEVVQQCGFLRHTEMWAGCSPDGYIGNFERLMSIKCRQPAAHWEFLRHGTVPADALAQLRHEVWITGAEGVDYFSWNPDFPEDMRARVVTFTRAQLDIPGYEAEAVKFLAEVEHELAAAESFGARLAPKLESIVSGFGEPFEDSPVRARRRRA